jgi:regulatory protein
MSAYAEGLKLLARRELSESQLRQRLARRGFAPDAIADALTRLKADRHLDDERVAGAIARLESGIRRRGPLRIRQRLAAAGITGALADRAIDEVMEGVDMEVLLAAALDRRLRDGSIADERTMGRLFRQLTSQGFEPDRVMRLLRTRRRATPDADG